MLHIEQRRDGTWRLLSYGVRGEAYPVRENNRPKKFQSAEEAKGYAISRNYTDLNEFSIATYEEMRRYKNIGK